MAEGGRNDRIQENIVTDASKRAALRLHGVPREDRQWIMARLEPSQRERISQYVAELERLGLMQDSAASFATEFAQVRESILNEDDVRESMAINMINRAEFAEIQFIMATEPVVTKLFVLRMYQWSWAPHYVKTLDPAIRRALQQQPSVNTKIKKKVRQETLKLLVARLAGVRTVDGIPSMERVPEGSIWVNFVSRARRTFCI